MTDTRHEQPRCPICRWPYRPGGCTPAQCQNPEPEDVDAELQPKGLQVLTLAEPVWVGPWTCNDPQCWERTMLKPHRAMPYTHNACVLQTIDGKWRYDAGHDRHGNPITKLGIETPEAAQSACEAAIIAAWRNR